VVKRRGGIVELKLNFSAFLSKDTEKVLFDPENTVLSPKSGPKHLFLQTCDKTQKLGNSTFP
jgi:hypothetical protein